MQSQGVIDCGYISKVYGIWYLQAFHSVGMSPLLEMHFEGSSTPVTVVSTYLAFVLDP
jgi:hypothetical protein